MDFEHVVWYIIDTYLYDIKSNLKKPSILKIHMWMEIYNVPKESSIFDNLCYCHGMRRRWPHLIRWVSSI